MSLLDHLQIRINGGQIFFLSQKIMSKYCGKLKKSSTQIIGDFPGGGEGFELVSRFCYNDGRIFNGVTVSNVALLHCCALFLDMSEPEEGSSHLNNNNNLLHQTEAFLEGIFGWSWNEILLCLKNCEPLIVFAESYGLIQRLIASLLAKMAQRSDVNNFFSLSSSSSSSSPDTAFSMSSPASRKASSWWYDDMSTFSPRIIQQFLKALGSYGAENGNLILTKFLLHYLKTARLPPDGSGSTRRDFTGLADTAVHGVVTTGRTAFSFRALFSVLRLASRFGVSGDLHAQLEELIGGMLDRAKLDDLLLSGAGNEEVYDVNLIIRLIKLFAHQHEKPSTDQMKKVGTLIDMYLTEIGPDPNLGISKFLQVAESLPDHARDTFDNVFRAVDIYLESHPSLSQEERSRLCRCLSYQKLSLEACKDLAKNPLIPPRIAIQALASQHPSIQQTAQSEYHDDRKKSISPENSCYDMVLYNNDQGKSGNNLETESSTDGEEKEDMKLNLEKMQWRVMELEKVCREMKGQMARMAKVAPQHSSICN
ncbi:hypothetical protein M569_10093 [Genlisea aurea]|uniref:NPH3 domain-containing protein n=1 Tax=Genlisea aurea TaxID=192259 RepID=S8CJ39_9LAMI|nr:hypothetical protein M569_10093 [Genlisea aurea]